MMKLKRLNGWQRLWVVASLVWSVVLAALLIIDSVPPSVGRLEADLAFDKAAIQREWVSNTIRAVPRTIFRLNPPGNLPEGFTLDDLTTDQIRDFYKRMSDEELVRAIHEKFPGVDFGPAELAYQLPLDALQLSHQKKVDGLVLAQAMFVGAVLLAWLIPSLGVYALAWGGRHVVLWVWRGFKLKGESNE